MTVTIPLELAPTATEVIRRFDWEMHQLFDLIEELKPDTDGNPRWEKVNRASLLFEAYKGVERLNGMVGQLRSLRNTAAPQVQEELDEAVFAAELSVDTATTAVGELCGAPVQRKTSSRFIFNLPVH